PFAASTAIASFQSRAIGGAFVGGALQALLATAVAASAAQLAVRSFGGYLEPHWAWSFAIAPVLLWGWWRASREPMSPAAAAGHLDRRLGSQGLLLCAHEGVPLEARWQAQLDEQLVRVPAALPRLRWRQLLPLPSLAVALAVGIALLPPPPSPLQAPQLAAAEAELERLTEAVRDLFARGTLPDEVEQEIEQKLKELQQKLVAGQAPEWRDLDQLEQRLEREQLLQSAAKLAKDTTAGSTARGGEGAIVAAVTPQQVAAIASALAAAGLLDQLPEAMHGLLREAQRGDGTFDPSALPADLAALGALAEALAKLGPTALQGMPEGMSAGALGLGAAQLADLRELLERLGAAGQGVGQGRGQAGVGDAQGLTEGDGVARGGVSRGPGHTALSMTESAAGGADAAMPLPPGQALPSEWVPVGEERREPEVNPMRSSAPGSAGAVGAGGVAWQLQLAPRHRAIVQRFFAPDGTTTREGSTKKDNR
ncbi:MAG: hypothetical protein ABIP94_21865, partial [Planctomycetota bacterium]